MHIDIHPLRVKVKKQGDLRVLFRKQASLVAFTHRTGENTVVNGAVVHPKQHSVCTGLGGLRSTGKSSDRYAVSAVLKRKQIFYNGRGPQRGQAVSEGLFGRKAPDLTIICRKGDTDIRSGKCKFRQPILAAFCLGAFGFKKF